MWHYITCDLSDAHYLECLMCELMLVMRKQHSIVTMNFVTLYFWFTLTPTGEHVVCYITSLFQTVILLTNTEHYSVLANYIVSI